MTAVKKVIFGGPKSNLTISSDDPVAFKFAMLYEWVHRKGNAEEVAHKFGYTREHLYAVKKAFEEQGSEGLKNKVSGPVGKSVRTESFNKEVIAHCFLDPEASAKVIAQKIGQCGIKCSIRSVERAVSELGLQKKTLRGRSS